MKVRTLDGDGSGAEHHALDVEDVAVVCDDDGHNGHAGLHGEVEGALLEGQQHGVLGVAARALGEHVDALLPGLDLLGGAGHGLPGVLGVLAVDEDGAAEAHEPAEEGDVLEVRLGGDAAPLGEHGAEHEDVKLGLVVADEDGGPGGGEDLVRVLDLEDDARGQAHDVVEGASGCPLRDALLADEGEEDGGEDAEDGADEERDVGGEGAGHEAGLGNGEGRHVEEEGDGDVAHEEVDEVADQGRHVGREEDKVVFERREAQVVAVDEGRLPKEMGEGKGMRKKEKKKEETNLLPAIHTRAMLSAD